MEKRCKLEWNEAGTDRVTGKIWNYERNLSELIINESRRARNLETSQNSLVNMSERLFAPGMWLIEMVLEITFSRTKFSRRSIHFIFLVVVPLDHWTAPWLSLYMVIGAWMGRARSRKSSLSWSTNFVASLMEWTSASQLLWAVFLCRRQPHAIGAPEWRTNQPEIDLSDLLNWRGVFFRLGGIYGAPVCITEKLQTTGGIFELHKGVKWFMRVWGVK